MADIHPHVTLLPSEPLPDGAPTPTLRENEHAEVYGLRDTAIVVLVKETDRDVSIRWHWSNTQDENVTGQVVAAIRQRHLKPEKKIALRLAGTETALIGALSDVPVGAEIMSKPVDANVTVPEGVTYRPMRTDEAEVFLKHVEEDFTKQMRTSRPDLNDEQAAEVAKVAFKNAAPQGCETPGHTFINVEEAGSTGAPVANLWVFLHEQSKESFCYDIEVAPEKRRKGFGRKTLMIWEHYAAQSGAIALGLNVFGTNTGARAMYHGYGFIAKEVSYVIEK